MVDEQTQRERLEHHILNRIRPITCLDGIKLLGCTPEGLTLRAHVLDSALNVRGFAHGGWLFSLCDTASGAFVFSQGFDCVTQQASINYLHGACVGEDVVAQVRNLHMGARSVVNEVTLTNQDGVTLAVCTLTMFIMGRMDGRG